MSAVAVGMVPLTSWFQTGIFVYWISTNTFAMTQVRGRRPSQLGVPAARVSMSLLTAGPAASLSRADVALAPACRALICGHAAVAHACGGRARYDSSTGGGGDTQIARACGIRTEHRALAGRLAAATGIFAAAAHIG